MMKYPWDDQKPIDWSKPWQDIAVAYQDKFFEAQNHLIDYYFARDKWRAFGILGWVIAALLAYCLFAVTP